MTAIPIGLAVPVGLALLVGGCGARTLLEVDPPASDAGVDAALRDGGGRDAARDVSMPFDVSRPDVVGDDVPPIGDAGLACQRDRDCLGLMGVCRLDESIPPDDLAPAPLVCGAPTRGAERCQAASDCERGLCVVAGACVAACVNDADCDEGHWCRDLWVRTAPDALQSLRGCVSRFDPHPDVELESLGTLSLRGPVADVAIPAVDSDRVLYLYESTRDVQLAAYTLVDGDGRVLFDVDTLVPGGTPPINPVTPFANPLAVLLPNAPGTISRSGWSMSVDIGRASDDLAVHRMQRSRTGRVLDVDVFYVGGGGLVPRGDTGPPVIARALGELVEAFGLRLGEVRQHDVVGGLRARYGILDSDPDGTLRELDEVFALSAGVGRASLSVFLLREMEGALGITGGIPGPWGANGRGSSGVALSVDLILEPTIPELMTTVGLVLTHEAGHYFGLYHTTEFDGTVIEPLPGTPVCPDSDGDGFVLPEECVGLGADNIMFWAGSGEALHAQQRTLVRSSMLLR